MYYKDIIDQMTLEEKASFMSGKDFWTTNNSGKFKIPSMFLSDGPNGIRKQVASSDNLGFNASLPATCYPAEVSMANTWNPDLIQEMAKHIGIEAASMKVNVVLGPGTNIKRDPLCGRNFEYFSEDPFLSGKMAAAYIRGVQSQGVSACLKHFAANNQEYRRMVIDSVIDERTLREMYLTPFRIGIQEGKPFAIMSSYNRLNGTYTNENMHLMKEILRDEWQFDGVVISDWGGSNDRVRGLIAGNSLEMPTTRGETNLEIIQAVQEGIIPENLLDENLDRLLNLTFSTDKKIKDHPDSFDIDAHHLIAQKVAEEAIVLLKNSDGALPLDKQSKISIMGDFAQRPRFQGAGSSLVNPTKDENFLSLIESCGALNYVGYEKGFSRYGRKSNNLLKKAISLGERSDIILAFVGLDEFSEVEGIDRKDMRLPKNQLDFLDALVETGKKIVVILSCGSPVELDFSDRVDAVLHASLSGQAGARAIINILTGKVNPSGKLSETYPMKYEDVPTSGYFPGKELTAEYREGPYFGYRYYEKGNIPVRFPFGFGLTYTEFEYQNLVVSEYQVSFTIMNIGKTAGFETAQLYVRALDSIIHRPFKELKGFQKVFLQPGESKEVTIELTNDAFAFYNPNQSNWEVEDLDYNIQVGSSSADIRLDCSIHISGIHSQPLNTPCDIPSYFSGNVKNVPDLEFESILGHPIPPLRFVFDERHHIEVNYDTTVEELKHSRGIIGRFVSKSVKFLIWALPKIGMVKHKNTLVMSLVNQPMRGLARMSGGLFSWEQLNGLIDIFNGKFRKGLIRYFQACKTRRARKKQKVRN